ncbi:hypothetical protein ONE63_007183 [Megalurothrips usitatus]|uniref:Pre-mRNA-processing factor 39 n=2 Tax=Megalurothrips usitatus TaxID=439358 RepID=A0AAV7XUI7_9NEOP|nr:hypothetical protein ONE63_007183 [Megalurothrips usitatus]
MASGSEDEVIGDGEEEVRPTRATRASARRTKKATPARGAKARRGRSAAATSDSSMEVDEMEQMNGSSNENGNSDAVPELDDAPPPPNVQPSPIRTGIKLKTNSISEDTPDDQTMITDTGYDGMQAVSEDAYVGDNTADESMGTLRLPEDSQETLDGSRIEEHNNETLESSDAGNNGIGGDVEVTPKKSASKRKLPVDGEYDPSSPTSENENEENPSKKAALSGSPKKDKEAKAKVLPELEKYWKAVKDDPADFTGWTYLLQYVDQENDVEAAREAYDAFLSHYPYCYGYWRKFADYEKKKGNKDQCEEVFARGLKAIPLSVDLWIHYLNYCRAAHADEEDFLRGEYEKALDACGMEFRSDRLWESYLKWEVEAGRLLNVTALYDRLLATPTQAYNTHFESFQAHVNENPPNKILSIDEFLKIRQEVLQQKKTFEQADAADDAAPPGDDLDAPPGEESEQVKIAKNDEETTAVRERIISIRKKLHSQTVDAVTARWNFEEGIKRPYFHVKPLERCQLKNWKEYLDYEIEQGEVKRIIVLFERCLIACALYEEFWIKFVKFLQGLKDGDWTDNIRDVLRRACTIHHPKKPSLHLFWSEFEESQGNYDKASDVLCHIEKLVPGMLQIVYRRINLERRQGNLDKASELYEHYISNSQNKTIVVNTAVKYARFCWKVQDDIDKAISILRQALETDKESSRLYLQLINMEMERSPMNEATIIEILDECISRDLEPEQKILFAQRKLEFLEDFGSDIGSIQRAQEEFQQVLKQCKDRKKKSDDKGAANLPATNYPPPNYAQNGTYAAAWPAQATVAAAAATGTTSTTATTTSATSYSQQYTQAGSYQSGDYSNYQNWNYSQAGYGGYNQAWAGYYNY